MIIYGSRMYFKKNVVRSYGQCGYCGRFSKQTSYQARKFGHLYFIPILPLGAHSQVLRECKSCSMGSHIPTNQLEPMIDGLSDQFKSWIIAINDGQTEVQLEPDLPPTNIGVLIAGILDDLYCLNEINDVESILAVLRCNNLPFEENIVTGRWFELQGDLDLACHHYRTACQLQPKNSTAVYQLGQTEVLRQDLEAAEQAFLRYAELEPEDCSSYLQLLDLCESKRDWSRLVSTCDLLFEREPEFLNEKKLIKLYKKACKKSGLQSKYFTHV